MMNAAAAKHHTPGPWRVEPQEDGCSVAYEIDGGGTHRIPIASTYWADGSEEPNANLIAAAPDLLSALKECALQIAQTHNRKLTTDEQIALDAARTAIAKAEARA